MQRLSREMHILVSFEKKGENLFYCCVFSLFFFFSGGGCYHQTAQFAATQQDRDRLQREMASQSSQITKLKADLQVRPDKDDFVLFFTEIDNLFQEAQNREAEAHQR